MSGLPNEPPHGYTYPIVQRELASETLGKVAEEMRTGAIKYPGGLQLMMSSSMPRSSVPTLTEDELLSADHAILRRFDGAMAIMAEFWRRAE